MADDFEDVLSGAWVDPEAVAGSAVALDSAVALLPAPSGKRTPEEVFAETYVRNGRDGAAAVRKAGLQDAQYEMSYVVERLLGRGDIQELIRRAEGMVSMNRDVGQYTREYFLHRLEEVGDRALVENQFNSVISATKLQAQMLGFLDQTVNVNHTVSPRELSLSELRALVQRGMGNVIEGEIRGE